MVKGCRRSMIVVRDTGSAVFEEAYFLLKEQMPLPLPGQDALIQEANRIIRERSVREEQKKSRKGARWTEAALWLASGFLCGMGMTFLILSFL